MVEALCLVLVEEVVVVVLAVAVGVEVAILAVMTGLSWTAGFVFHEFCCLCDIFIQGWAWVQVGAEVWIVRQDSGIHLSIHYRNTAIIFCVTTVLIVESVLSLKITLTII